MPFEQPPVRDAHASDGACDRHGPAAATAWRACGLDDVLTAELIEVSRSPVAWCGKDPSMEAGARPRVPDVGGAEQEASPYWWARGFAAGTC
jgi:hypothetical protein